MKTRRVFSTITNPNGTIRVVFCTVAFVMGIDIPNVRIVVHYGPSTDVDDYFQECGRAGRDGGHCLAILYCYPCCTLGHVSPAMKDYCASEDTCRRKHLLDHFRYVPQEYPVKHMCCDVCSRTCACEDDCPFRAERAEVGPFEVEDEDSDSKHEEPVSTREVSQAQREQLQKSY